MDLSQITRIFLMSKKVVNIIFLVFAILSLLALLYHLRGIFYPNELTPVWRHALFVFINFICIYGFLKRPKWFTWFVGLLSLQQCYSHGSYAIKLWENEHTIHWISIGVIILLPVALLLLLLENRKVLLT